MDWILDLLLEISVESYLKLMLFIVPERLRSDKLQTALRVIFKIIAVLLLISAFFGIFACLSADEEARLLGRQMVRLPLIVSGVQIALGLLIRLFGKRKK